MSCATQLKDICTKLGLPVVLHRSGKGRPGRGSAWVVKSFYPVRDQYYAMAAAPTLAGALKKFRAQL